MYNTCWTQPAAQKEVYGYIRGNSKAPPMPSSSKNEAGEVITHPAELGQFFARSWQRIWTNSKSPTLSYTHKKLQQLYQYAKEHPFPTIVPSQITDAIRRIKRDTAVGIDLWGPMELRHIQEASTLELTKLLNTIEATVAWLQHVLLNIVTLMGKPNGGTRPIALMPMLYRLWSKIRRPYISEWERAHQGPWDAAAPGLLSFTSCSREPIFG